MGEPATLEVGMTEADLSNKNLGIRGAIIISAWITHKDKGALSSLNLANNIIGRFSCPGKQLRVEGVNISSLLLNAGPLIRRLEQSPRVLSPLPTPSLI
jgi:hypothetical protein